MTLDTPTLCRRCGATLPGGWASPSCPRCLVHFSVEATDPARVFPGSSGRIELGDYELLDEIARGGMGVVYRARQTRLGRTVAVKVLAAGEFAGVEARRRFRIEAEAVARLQHPGIVAVHDVGETDGLPWLSMDFVAGENLAALVREQPLPARQAAEYARAIAEAVQHAHEHGVLHRDLKPSNVLLDPDAGPRVTDFGIARCGDVELTRTGEVLGSPGYAAPEQAFGGTADARTDVYGLGALLYHLLTARPPFQGPTPDAILLQLCKAEPLAPRRLNPAVPRDLETICLRCLRKEPARRYPTARDLADDLSRFQRGEAIHAKPVSVFGKTWRWCRRHPGVAAMLAVLAVVTVFAFWRIETARRDESAAKSRAENASAQLREANARLGDSLDGIELDRAEDVFRAGDSAGALAPLMRVVRRNPAHSVAGPRLAAALWHGDFALPLPLPMVVGGKISRMQFLRDGRTLLVSSGNGATMWDAAAGRRLLEFERGDGRFSGVASPDERTLVEWDERPGGSVRILDMATGRLRAPPIFHEGWLHSVAFSPDSTRFVTAGSSAAGQIHDAQTGQPLGGPLIHPGGLWAAVFSPDGESIATCTDTTVYLWEVRTLRLRAKSAPMEREVMVLRISPDGRSVMAGASNGTARLVSTADGQLTGPPMRHEREIRAGIFSPDGTRLLTCSMDRTARTWSVPGGEPLTPTLRHGDTINFAAFSPDGARVVTCASDHMTRVWDARTGRPLTQPLRHSEQPLAAAFSPDGSTLYAGGSDGIVHRWDLRHPAEPHPASLPPASEPGGVRTSADGRMKITFGEGANQAMLTDVKTGAAIGSPLAHMDGIEDAEFSPDGTLVATASRAKNARVWETSAGRAVSPPLRHARPVSAVAFSPDSRRIATASWDGTARIWDVRTGEPLTRPLAHDDHVTGVQFSPDGRRVATASRDKTARVWDAASGQPLTEPLRHDAPVERVRFDPGGQRITTKAGNASRIWDAPDFSTPLPAWLPDLAEIISLADLPSDPIAAYALIARYEKTRADALATPGDDAYARLARRLFAPRAVEPAGH